jgi:tetratricopeptide (TPR) repeat protein
MVGYPAMRIVLAAVMAGALSILAGCDQSSTECFDISRGPDHTIAACTQALNRVQAPRDHATAYMYRCEAYTRKQEFAKALADCNEAIELDPKNVAAYFTRGNVHYANKDYDRAIVDFSKSIELDPKYYRGL